MKGNRFAAREQAVNVPMTSALLRDSLNGLDMDIASYRTRLSDTIRGDADNGGQYAALSSRFNFLWDEFDSITSQLEEVREQRDAQFDEDEERPFQQQIDQLVPVRRQLMHELLVMIEQMKALNIQCNFDNRKIFVMDGNMAMINAPVRGRF